MTCYSNIDFSRLLFKFLSATFILTYTHVLKPHKASCASDLPPGVELAERQCMVHFKETTKAYFTNTRHYTVPWIHYLGFSHPIFMALQAHGFHESRVESIFLIPRVGSFTSHTHNSLSFWGGKVWYK